MTDIDGGDQERRHAWRRCTTISRGVLPESHDVEFGPLGAWRVEQDWVERASERHYKGREEVQEGVGAARPVASQNVSGGAARYRAGLDVTPYGAANSNRTVDL